MNKDYLKGWEDALDFVKDQYQVMEDMGDEEPSIGLMGAIKGLTRWIEQYKEANK